MWNSSTTSRCRSNVVVNTQWRILQAIPQHSTITELFPAQSDTLSDSIDSLQRVKLYNVIVSTLNTEQSWQYTHLYASLSFIHTFTSTTLCFTLYQSTLNFVPRLILRLCQTSSKCCQQACIFCYVFFCYIFAITFFGIFKSVVFPSWCTTRKTSLVVQFLRDSSFTSHNSITFL